MVQATIPFQKGTTKPSDEGEQLAEVTMSRSSGGPRGQTVTVPGPFPLSMDGFRWHFYSEQRGRFVSFCQNQPRRSIEIIGVTDDDRRLRGRISQLAIGYDGVTVYAEPPQR